VSPVILVPLDGSPLSEHALPFAAHLARAGGLPLALVRAVELFVPDDEEVDESEHPMLAEAQAYLQAVASRLTTTGLQVECLVPYGRPVEQIVAVIRTRDTRCVVMATHGRSGFGRWLYGSVADAVLTHSPAPVALVPADAPAPTTTEGGDRVLITLDGSALGETVLPAAAELAARLGAEIVLLRVVAHRDAERLAEANAYLMAVARRLTDDPTTHGLRVRVRVEVGRAPAAVIARVAEDEHATTMVMATHGRSGVGRMLLGSVATGTLRRASVPLLLIRAGASEPTATSG
jgi:nucleotide-binding universal stress UspA family protein